MCKADGAMAATDERLETDGVRRSNLQPAAQHKPSSTSRHQCRCRGCATVIYFRNQPLSDRQDVVGDVWGRAPHSVLSASSGTRLGRRRRIVQYRYEMSSAYATMRSASHASRRTTAIYSSESSAYKSERRPGPWIRHARYFVYRTLTGLPKMNDNKQ